MPSFDGAISGVKPSTSPAAGDATLVKGYHAGLLFGPLVVEFCGARGSQKPQAQWNDYRYWIAGDSIPMPFLYPRQEANAMLPKPEALLYALQRHRGYQSSQATGGVFTYVLPSSRNY